MPDTNARCKDSYRWHTYQWQTYLPAGAQSFPAGDRPHIPASWSPEVPPRGPAPQARQLKTRGSPQGPGPTYPAAGAQRFSPGARPHIPASWSPEVPPRGPAAHARQLKTRGCPVRPSPTYPAAGAQRFPPGARPTYPPASCNRFEAKIEGKTMSIHAYQ